NSGSKQSEDGVVVVILAFDFVFVPGEGGDDDVKSEVIQLLETGVPLSEPVDSIRTWAQSVQLRVVDGMGVDIFGGPDNYNDAYAGGCEGGEAGLAHENITTHTPLLLGINLLP
ncbi:hypothetical protein U1Q18_004695, partial [Sarracenia purpurea var. burkii]